MSTTKNFAPIQTSNGIVILLNGASSSGKSSIAKELQAIFEEPYLHLSIDGWLTTMPQRFWGPGAPQADQGFEWVATSDERGPVTIVRAGPWGKKFVSGIMEPAFMSGHWYFLNRIAPYLWQYKINDTILFKHEEKVWISRIVALENDTIHLTEGSIVVNGATLQEVGIHRNWAHWKHGAYALEKPLQVPQDHIFVLSDNLSAQHDDSRVFGPVSKESILGVVW